MPRELLFSVTKKDFKVTVFRGSGPGGQSRNKTSTAVRIKHPESGATAESQVYKSQDQNKQAAFRKLVESPTFEMWRRKRTAELMGRPTVEQVVDKAMDPRNLKVEGKVDDRWEKLDD